jgi:branched-chain amino acid transport system ATP-binding protein
MLKIENLKASYGKVEVLHGITIEVPKGKIGHDQTGGR